MKLSAMTRWGSAALLLSFSVICFGEEVQRDVQQHCGQGLASQQAGQFDEAMSEYQQCISLDPTSSNAFFNLGLIFYGRKQWPQAIDAFKRVADLTPLDGGAHFHLAATYVASGTDLVAALKHYDRSRELHYQGDPLLGELLEPLRNTDIDVEYEPTLYPSSQKVKIHISGNPRGEQQLERDVMRMIEISEHARGREMFDAIHAEFLRQEGERTWFEKWIVQSKNTTSTYQVRFDLSPSGGTDFAVTEIKE